MWLLDTNADQPKLRQCIERKEYAILSHRWESSDEELLYDEITQGNYSRKKAGLYKVFKATEQAQKDGLDFLWIDTCCIDRKSSAELQEAINSMYTYYSRASVCYVYLRDVHATEDGSFNASFLASEWFQRGWTLQELLAPHKIHFYDAEWQYLGDKHSSRGLLSAATGISENVFRGERNIRGYSLAQRMSWAAKRQTTRVEDRAYSLLGIFNVNMPMLYGEGERAFLRLQQEIINASDDHSIFAWTGSIRGGILASSPDAFADSSDIQIVPSRQSRRPYNFGNRGLSIEMLLAPYCPDTYLAVIYCARERFKEKSMGIFLRQMYQDDQYARVSVYGEYLVDDAFERIQERQCDVRSRPIYIGLEPPYEDMYLRDREYRMRLKMTYNGKPLDMSSTIKVIWGQSDSSAQFIEAMPSHRRPNCVLMAVDITSGGHDLGLVMSGFDQDFNPVILISSSSGIPAWSVSRKDWSDKVVLKSITPSEIQILDHLFREYCRLNPKVTFGSSLDWVDVRRPKGSKGNMWVIRVDREDGTRLTLRNGDIFAAQISMVRTNWLGNVMWELGIFQRRG